MKKNYSEIKNPNAIRAIKTYNPKIAFFVSILHGRSLCALFSYLKTVASDFFILQFLVKWKLKKMEIIFVDHPLDNKVPFVPEKVHVYLDFVAFWVRPMTMMYKTIRHRSIRHIMQYLELIDKAYKTAASFYRFRLTTTKRPTHKVSKQFDFIRRVDPHYLCVPSLHISIVLLTVSYFKKAFAEEYYSTEQQAAYNAELYAGAVEIAEAVLYVKQHSVNCIPAALFMMVDIIPDLFTVQDAVLFIDQLFLHAEDILPEDRNEIIGHIHFLFDRLLLERKFDETWDVPLKRWILGYQKQRSALFADFEQKERQKEPCTNQ